MTAINDRLPVVLIVEDDRAVSTFLADALAADAETLVARDGEAGLAMAIDRHPDVILSDLMMPKMDGTALLTALRARHDFDNTPIVMLTSSTDYDLRVRLLRAGAQDYLSKPCLIEELRARLANLWSVKRAKEILQHSLQSQSDDLHLLAETLAARDRELKSALEQMSVACENAEHASTAKSAFLASVSHELLTPIATMQLQLVGMARHERRGDQGSSVDALGRQCQRLRELIESVLAYVRAESGRLPMTLEPIDLSLLLAEVIAEVRDTAERKRLYVRLQVPHALPHFVTDRKLLRVVLLNLVSNGIKFTEQGGVLLRVSTTAEQLSLHVMDTGAGISTAEQRAIFEPFVRLEPIAHQHTQGLGLGLTLVRDIVNALGGRIELQSEIDRGSEFAVHLPITVSEAMSKSA